MSLKILLIDNFDSFTYNIAQIVREYGAGVELTVKRNNQLAIESVAEYHGIILSPGPGLPSEAGLMPEIVKYYADSKPFLGICLGHQCLAESFGAKLVNLNEPFHGRSERVFVEKEDELLFKNLPREFNVGRYHSWVVSDENLPAELYVTARDANGLVMAISHKLLNLKGVQFHPESVLTEHGPEMVSNWLASL